MRSGKGDPAVMSISANRALGSRLIISRHADITVKKRAESKPACEGTDFALLGAILLQSIDL